MLTQRRALMAFTLLSSIAAAPPAMADAATEALVKEAIAFIDASAKWEAKAASIVTEGEATVVKNLAITETGIKSGFTMETLKVTGAARNPDGSFTLALAVASGITGGDPKVQITVPELRIESFASPSFAGWSFDPARPFSTAAQFYTRLAKTEFALVAIPSALVQMNTNLGGTSAVHTTTLSGMRYEGMKGGTLAGMTTGKIESAAVGAANNTGPDLMRWEGLNATSVNFGGLARVLDADAYAGGKGDMKWTDVFGSLKYGKLTVVNGAAEIVTMNGIEIAGLQVRQTEKPMAPGLDQFGVGQDKLSEEQKFAIMQEYGKSFVGWMRLGSLKIGEMKVKPKEGGDMKLASVSIDDLSPDGLKRVAMAGLAFTAPAPEAPGGMVTGAMKIAEITDVEFPSFDAFMALAQFGNATESGKTLSASEYQKALTSFFSIYPKIGGMNIEGVSFAMPGMEPVEMDSYTFTSTGPYMGPLAAKSETELKGLKVPGAMLRMEPQTAQIMDGLGYAGLEFALKDVQTYDKASGAVADRLALTGKDMGTFRFGFNLNGLTRQRVEEVMTPVMAARGGQDPDMPKIIAAAQGFTFDGMSLRFEDASLTQRVITLAAKMQGQDEKTFVNNTTAMAQLGLAQLQHPEFTSKVIAALNTFLADPKSLTITAAPGNPVGVNDAMGLAGAPPNRIIDLLGVTVTAND